MVKTWFKENRLTGCRRLDRGDVENFRLTKIFAGSRWTRPPPI
jgi:hypothetical protein